MDPGIFANEVHDIFDEEANDSLYGNDGKIFITPDITEITKAGFEAADMDCAAADATSDVTDTCATVDMVYASTIFPGMDPEVFNPGIDLETGLNCWILDIPMTFLCLKMLWNCFREPKLVVVFQNYLLIPMGVEEEMVVRLNMYPYLASLMANIVVHVETVYDSGDVVLVMGGDTEPIVGDSKTLDFTMSQD